MASLEELNTKIEELQRQLTQKPAIRVTQHRKLDRFSGNERDARKTTDWVEDARAVLQTVPADEQVSFILSHLTGTAREEVRFAEETKKDSTEKIFNILEDNFGEKRSDAQLKTALYDRFQKNSETVRQYSRALLELANKIRKQTDKDKLLVEVFCENLGDVYVRREIKKILRDNPDTKFTTLRDLAIQLAEDEGDTLMTTTASSSQAAATANVNQCNESIDLKSLVDSN